MLTNSTWRSSGIETGSWSPANQNAWRERVSVLIPSQDIVFTSPSSSYSRQAVTKKACDRITMPKVAVVSGTASGPCQPAAPISIVIMHGTHDPTFPYAEAEENAVRWRDLLACQGGPTRLAVGDLATGDDYTACDDGAALRFITIENGSHAWFHAPDATEAVWSFFESLARR